MLNGISLRSQLTTPEDKSTDSAKRVQPLTTSSTDLLNVSVSAKVFNQLASEAQAPEAHARVQALRDQYQRGEHRIDFNKIADAILDEIVEA